MSIKVIDKFIGEYRFLSNFYEIRPPMIFEGMTGNTVEHIFQAYKTTNETERSQILLAETPGRAKRLGAKCTLRNDWEDIKYKLMLDLVTVKFKSNAFLQDKLLETKKIVLIEGNVWHDNVWGNCFCDKCKNIEGKNWLGKILMLVREQCNNELSFIDYEKDTNNGN